MEINLLMVLLDIISLDVKFYLEICFVFIKYVLGVRPLSFLRVPLYASGEKTIKAPIFVRNYLGKN